MKFITEQVNIVCTRYYYSLYMKRLVKYINNRLGWLSFHSIYTMFIGELSYIYIVDEDEYCVFVRII